MNKNTIISFLVIIVVVILGVIFYKYLPKQAPESPTQVLEREAGADTTDEIDNSLNSVDVDASMDADLKAIDDELNNI
jgi:hypothetical protein